MKKLTFYAMLLLVPGALAGCGEREKGSYLTAHATVQNANGVDFCGCYMLVVETTGSTKVWLKPTYLPENMQIDGLKVKIQYSTTNEMHNCGFGGHVNIVNVHRIEKIQ